jgi:hypothetical protein
MGFGVEVKSVKVKAKRCPASRKAAFFHWESEALLG